MQSTPCLIGLLLFAMTLPFAPVADASDDPSVAPSPARAVVVAPQNCGSWAPIDAVSPGLTAQICRTAYVNKIVDGHEIGGTSIKVKLRNTTGPGSEPHYIHRFEIRTYASGLVELDLLTCTMNAWLVPWPTGHIMSCTVNSKWGMDKLVEFRIYLDSPVRMGWIDSNM